MGNFRVDFAHNKRKSKVFVAKITPNQCDEFVPRRGKYSRKNFLAKGGGWVDFRKFFRI